MTRNGPNARLQSAADKLHRYTAQQVTNAVEMLRDRIAHAHQDSGSGETVHTSDIANPTATVALQRVAWTAELEDLRDAITDACHTLDLLATRAEDIQRWCNPSTPAAEIKLCKHGQVGLQGVI